MNINKLQPKQIIKIQILLNKYITKNNYLAMDYSRMF